MTRTVLMKNVLKRYFSVSDADILGKKDWLRVKPVVALPLTYRERSLTKSVHSKLSRTVFTRSWPKKCHLKEGHLPENPKIVEFSIIPEIPRRISNGTEIPGTQVSKIWVNLAKVSSFRKFWKTLLH